MRAGGDTTPHLQQTEISITSGGDVVERSQRQPGWWQGKRVEVSVNGIWFVLGRASGESCNCLIDTLRQLLPTFLCSVSFVRAELERRHARTPTAIAPLDFLDLALYWSDIVDISGQYNMLGRIQKLSSRFRICCVDMCWVGHGEVLPRDVPASARQTLYVARVNQNHFVPLQRSRQRGGEVPRASIADATTQQRMESAVAEHVNDQKEGTTPNTNDVQTILPPSNRSSSAIETVVRTTSHTGVECNALLEQAPVHDDSAAAEDGRSFPDIAKTADIEDNDEASTIGGTQSRFLESVFETLYGNRPWEDFAKEAQGQEDPAVAAENVFRQHAPDPMGSLIDEMVHRSRCGNAEDIAGERNLKPPPNDVGQKSELHHEQCDMMFRIRAEPDTAS